MYLIKKYHPIFFTLFQLFIFVFSTISENKAISIILLTYFYYSTFTGWHECAHKDFSIKGFSFYKVLGMINMTPLLFFSYRQKLKQHLLHHQFTNDPINDPDYKSNNLILSSYFKNARKNSSLKVNFKLFEIVELISKSLFVFAVVKFWILNNLAYQYIFSYLLGILISHLLINIIPHYNFGLGEGRNFKAPKIFNLIFLANNLHGLHHKYPTKAWWNFI